MIAPPRQIPARRPPCARPPRLLRAAAWNLGFLLVLLLNGCNGRPPARVAAVDGVLDLRNASLDAVISLEGEWRAESGSDGIALAAFDYDDTRWRRVHVAAYFQEQGFPDEGLVWYRLHVRLPPDAPPLKGCLQHANNAHVIYAATPGQPPVELAASGSPARTASETVPSRKPVTFLLPQDTTIVLSWKVANHNYLNGGPFFDIQIGSVPIIDRLLLRHAFVTFTGFGLYLLMAVSFLLGWYWRRDPRALAVGLLALAMALRTLALSGTLEQLLPGLVDFNLRIMLEATSYLALNGLLGMLFWSFFPREFLNFSLGRLQLRPPPHMQALEEEISGPPRPLLPPWLRLLNTLPVMLAVTVSGLFVAMALLNVPRLTSQVLVASRWISLLLVVPSVAIVTQALERRRPLSGIMALGFLPVVVGGVHDLLLAEGLLMNSIYVSNYAILGFMLIQSFAVARRNARYAELASRHAQTLKQEVERRTGELEAAMVAAQAASVAKSRFVSSVSHELRTPLASMLGYTQVLEDELAPVIQKDHAEFFHTIRKSGERLVALINDLLDIGKIEAGRMELFITPVAVRDAVDEVWAQLFLLASEKDLSLQPSDFQVDDAYVLADEDRLRQVLTNLLSNAIKFTESGQVGIRVRQTDLSEKPACAISVYDTGPGISPDFLPELFEAFTQEIQSSGQTQEGTGLGLAISHQLVAQMHGTLTVETEPGVGSTFTITLPVAAPPARHTAPSAWDLLQADE